MHNTKDEILISASLVTQAIEYNATYEFIINGSLNVRECIQIEQYDNRKIKPVRNPMTELKGLLFELNHVRVNPKVDNNYIIDCIIQALHNIDVTVENRPHVNSMAVCFMPLGEISANVRFYLNSTGQIIFLSPIAKPKLVSISKP
jgi:hypothetical protein